MASAAVQGHHSEIWRVTPRHRVEHKCHREGGWSEWKDFGFDRAALDVAAVSGWPEHIELFVLDTTGRVWHLWWWKETKWQESFSDLGQPFGDADPRGISAVSAWPGHMRIFVETADFRIAHLWFEDGGEGWRRCREDWALQDGSWPFSTE